MWQVFLLTAFMNGNVVVAEGNMMGAEGNHYTANYCELYIDRVVAYEDAHKNRSVNFFVRTWNSRLDSEVVEVGFRNHARMSGSGAVSAGVPAPAVSVGTVAPSVWVNTRLDLLFDGDYWVLHLPLSNERGGLEYEGVFYVRTHKNTYYWLRSGEGGNYIFNGRTYDAILEAMGKTFSYVGSYGHTISTAMNPLGFLNPQQCR